jgi:DNA-binding SARP family transcriptional activator
LEPELPEKFPSRYIKVVEGLVSLTVPEGTQIDFEAFESACQEQDWEKALSLYSGEFLPNYLYANWAILPRQRLAFLYQQALLNQAEIWFTKGEYSASLDACRKVLALEPWQEQAAFLAMKACLGIGNRACARRIYRQLEKALGDELDIRPQEELRKFYQSL